MNYRNIFVALLVAALIPLAACGSDDDSTTDYVAEGAFDESQLPADFPHELIPPSYDIGYYNDMTAYGGVEGAGFENSVPVLDTIDYYKALLGEPTVYADAGDGAYVANWHETPGGTWMLGVMGDDTESLISVGKIPQGK